MAADPQPAADMPTRLPASVSQDDMSTEGELKKGDAPVMGTTILVGTSAKEAAGAGTWVQEQQYGDQRPWQYACICVTRFATSRQSG